MIRTGRLLMILLAAAGVTAAAAAAADGQPPRRTRYPDSSRTASSPPRYSLAGYGGFRLLQVESQLFESNEVDFGITEEDFGSGRIGFELGFAVHPALDLVFGFETGSAQTTGNYLDFTYEDGSEIEHWAQLRMTEVSLGARFRPLRGARLSPYLVLGVSGASYDYIEDGDFVNFDTFDIYYDAYQERQFLPGLFAGAGLDFAVVDLPFGRRLDVFGEFRYARAQGEHQDGFDGFGDLTLDRMGGLFGLRIRF